MFYVVTDKSQVTELSEIVRSHVKIATGRSISHSKGFELVAKLLGRTSYNSLVADMKDGPVEITEFKFKDLATELKSVHKVTLPSDIFDKLGKNIEGNPVELLPDLEKVNGLPDCIYDACLLWRRYQESMHITNGDSELYLNSLCAKNNLPKSVNNYISDLEDVSGARMPLEALCRLLITFHPDQLVTEPPGVKGIESTTLTAESYIALNEIIENPLANEEEILEQYPAIRHEANLLKQALDCLARTHVYFYELLRGYEFSTLEAFRKKLGRGTLLPDCSSKTLVCVIRVASNNVHRRDFYFGEERTVLLGFNTKTKAWEYLASGMSTAVCLAPNGSALRRSLKRLPLALDELSEDDMMFGDAVVETITEIGVEKFCGIISTEKFCVSRFVYHAESKEQDPSRSVAAVEEMLCCDIPHVYGLHVEYDSWPKDENLQAPLIFGKSLIKVSWGSMSEDNFILGSHKGLNVSLPCGQTF